MSKVDFSKQEQIVQKTFHEKSAAYMKKLGYPAEKISLTGNVKEIGMFRRSK